MKALLFVIFLLPGIGNAHPGIGIVKDSKGNIFYTDLKHVWKISNGARKVVVPDVHTHELYVDAYDNLFGEGSIYEAATEKHYHYLWVYRPEGVLDTVVGLKQAYIHHDYSLARDKHGNEYYIKQFLVTPDTFHIYRRSPKGKETIFATGNFKGITWLHPQENGSLLYVLRNNVYRVDTAGSVHLIKERIGSKTPSFTFLENNITVWGAWEDNEQNVYVAVFSDQAIKRIDTRGNVSVYYKSKDNWTPLHGVFDNDNRLWVLEGSNKNDVRVVQAESKLSTGITKKKMTLLPYTIAGMLALAILILLIRRRKPGLPLS